MNLKDIVVSLDLAKELKANNFPQDTHFKYCGGHIMYWENHEDGEFEECTSTDVLGDDEYCHTAELTCEFFIAAPTASEIGEQLPDEIDKNNALYELNISAEKQWRNWWCSYAKDNLGIHLEKDHSMAGCLGKMWIYLKKNGLLEDSHATN